MYYHNFVNAPTGICITDENGTIQEANSSFLTIYGYSLDETIGNNPRILKSARQSPNAYRDMWNMLTDPAEGYWSGEIINRKKNGEEVTVHLTVSAVRDINGRLIGFIATTIDLTEHKRIERYLEDCNRELVEVSQLKSNLLAITSHDLKSPLNAMISRAGMLRDMAQEMTPAKQLEQLEKIIESGFKMSAFIDELLDLEKMEAGRFQLSTARTHMDTLLQACIETNLPTAAEKNITLELLLLGKQGPIRADIMKLEQVFNNIISNAIKFTPAGGRITITCTSQSDGKKLVTIADNGPGIPESHLPHIFDRYYQVKNDGRAPGRVYGAGLGLSIAKNIVDLHGGSVTASNRTEGGCEFAITLPGKGKARSGQDIAALIVDPNHQIYAHIEPHLRHKGVSCYIAGNLHEASRVCLREQPEMVFTDLAFHEAGIPDLLADCSVNPLVTVVTGNDCPGWASLSRVLSPPVMDVEIFALIDELLFEDGGKGE